MDLSASIGLRLAAGELPGARAHLASRLAQEPTPELYLASGLVNYLVADFSAAQRDLEAAFLGFKEQGRVRRAAVAAAHLARLFVVGLGNEAVANGWIGRATRLLADEGDCVERGWVALHVTGCNMPDVDELERRADEALAAAARFGDVDLECKALADSGLALVGHGRVVDGMARLDEAMAMASSGECDNAFITGQIRCCLISACERTGDLPRLEGWLSVASVTDPALLGPDAPPNLVLGHCQSQYGTLLCQAGRWDEAESALQHGVDIGDVVHFHQRASSRAALAGLRIDQGRLLEAAQLLDGLEQTWEAQLSVVRLHRARGDDDLAAATARQALRTFTGDRLRAAPLLAVLVDAELARGGVEAAAEGVRALATIADEAPHPPVVVLAHRAAAQLALAQRDGTAAVASLETALHALPGEDWPLLAAHVRLDLALALAETDRTLAVAEARRALAVLSRLGASRGREAQELLRRLGVSGLMPAEQGPVAPLTSREREILRLVAEGLSNPQIATRLVISPRTAEHHVGAILRKLQLGSRSEAAVYAATMTR